MSLKRAQVNIRLDPQERRQFNSLARKKHKRLSEWFRDLARRELERQQIQRLRREEEKEKRVEPPKPGLT